MTRFFRLLPTAVLLLATAELSAGGSTTFTGFQAGFVGGGQVGRVEFNGQNFTDNSLICPTGFQAGLQLGYGINLSSFFVGLDVAILKDWSTDNMSVNAPVGAGAAAVVMPVQMKVRKPYTFFVGPRVGMQFGNALPYLRVGYTQSKYGFKMDYPQAGRWTRETANITRKGFILGGGIDFSLCSSMIIGLSYDHTFFGGYKEMRFNTQPIRLKCKSHNVLLKIAYKI